MCKCKTISCAEFEKKQKKWECHCSSIVVVFDFFRIHSRDCSTLVLIFQKIQNIHFFVAAHTHKIAKIKEYRSIDWLIDWSTHWWLIGWLIDHLINSWLVDWWIKSLNSNLDMYLLATFSPLASGLRISPPYVVNNSISHKKCPSENNVILDYIFSILNLEYFIKYVKRGFFFNWKHQTHNCSNHTLSNIKILLKI